MTARSNRSRSDQSATATPAPGRRGGRSSQEESAPLDRIPAWAAPVLYAVVTLILFRDFVFSDEMLLSFDTLGLGYMARAFFADALRAGTFPLWNPVILGGTPFLESLAGGDSLYPPSVLLLLLMETYRSLGWKLVLHVFLAGVFMYGWLRTLDTSRGAALLGGLGFLLAPHMVTLVFPGHDGKLFVVALTPLVFWMAEWSLRRRSFLPLAGLGVSVALVILTTHFQMAYFLFGAVGAYMIFRTVAMARAGAGWGPPLRRFGLFLAFSVVGAGAAAVQLLPAVGYITSDSRRAATTVEADPADARAYGTSWSLHPEEVVGLVVPEFVGSSEGESGWTAGTYWGRNAFKLNHEYLGLIVLLLAGIGFLGGPARGLRWFMVGMGSVVLLFTLGAHTPVWRFFYEVLPGVSLFRAPSMAIFLTGFAAATLAGLGVDHGVRLLQEGRAAALLRYLMGAMGVLALGTLLAASGLLQTLWLAVFDPGLTEAKAEALSRAAPFITQGFFTALLFSGLLAGLWWLHAKGRIPAGALVAAVALLVGVDQLRVNAPFIRTMDYFQWSQPDGNLRFLMERQGQETPFRVFSMMGNSPGQDVTPGMHGLELAGGHHPNDLLRYRELIGMEGSGVPENLALFNPNVLRILNVRYILWPVASFGAIDDVEPVSQLAFADGRIHSAVYQYPDLPRARVVGGARVVNPSETLDWVLDPERFDPSVETILVEPPPLTVGGPQVQGEAEWLERTPNRLHLRARADGPAILVLSENWSPGWSATVDGTPTPVMRADHTLRGVALPGGTHEVELTFQGPYFQAGLTLSILSTLLLLGAGIGGFLQDRRSRGRPSAEG